MEKMAGEHDQKLDVRLKETVGLMLVVSTPWEEVQKFPGLMAVCKVEFDKGREAAKFFVGAKRYDSGEKGPGAGGPPPPPSPAQVAGTELGKSHGYAIPAVVELAKDPSPPARMYAMQFLLALGATGQRPSLDALQKDTAQVSVFHGDYTTSNAIGTTLTKALRSRHPFVGTTPENAAAYEAEQYLPYLDWLSRGAKAAVDYELINRLRQEAKAYDSPSWEEYWKRARPILKEVWTPPSK
jgi:hypothetical protein